MKRRRSSAFARDANLGLMLLQRSTSSAFGRKWTDESAVSDALAVDYGKGKGKGKDI